MLAIQKLTDPRSPEDIKFFCDKVFAAVQELQKAVQELQEQVEELQQLLP
jgi:uncharacterized protein YoxC